MFERNVETFLTVADSGSFSKASEKLFVSKTALILQMNLLEDKLGFKLLERSNRGVTLTKAGTEYYKETKKMITKYTQLLNNCTKIASSDGIKIGMLPNFPSIVLPKICSKYRQKYPNRRLDFVESSLDNYFNDFMNGKFDITAEYMVGYYYNNPNYTVLELQKSYHCIGIPQDNYLSKKDEITINDLIGQRVMMHKKGITLADDNLRNYLEKNVPDITILDIENYTSSLSMICQLYNCLLIFYNGYESNFPGLVKHSIKLEEIFPVKIGIGYHKHASQYVHDLIELAKEIYL